MCNCCLQIAPDSLPAGKACLCPIQYPAIANVQKASFNSVLLCYANISKVIRNSTWPQKIYNLVVNLKLNLTPNAREAAGNLDYLYIAGGI